MKTLKLVTCFFILFANSAKSQFAIVTNEVTQIPLAALPSSNDEDTPYLYNETFTGSVVLANGNTLSDLNILYDLRKDYPIIVKENGIFVKFNILPRQFELMNAKYGKQLFRLGYPVKPTGYLEVLADGKNQLLKKYAKNFAETSVFATGKVEKKAVFSESYYLYDNEKMVKVKKDPLALIAKLPKNSQSALNLYYNDLKKQPHKLTVEDIMILIIEKSNELS